MNNEQVTQKTIENLVVKLANVEAENAQLLAQVQLLTENKEGTTNVD